MRTVTVGETLSLVVIFVWLGACGGGGSGAADPPAGTGSAGGATGGGGDPGGGGTGDGTGSGGTTSKAGVWQGAGCCVDATIFPVIGMTSDSSDTGATRFLFNGLHYVGRMGEPQAAYATDEASLAGGPATIVDGYDWTIDVLPGQKASGRTPPLGCCDPMTARGAFFDVPLSEDFHRPSSTGAVAGVYTSNAGTGYTLTIAIDSAGRVFGNDTNGCSVLGDVATADPSVNYYDVALAVSRCGNRDGSYQGNATLLAASADTPSRLFLSVSNASAAIGWLLDGP